MSVEPCSVIRMSDMLNDPEFWLDMESMGVVRESGQARAATRDSAPLLADDGSDPFNPSGHRRDQAITVLRDFTETLGAGEFEAAHDVLLDIAPHPTKDFPAASQVIGTGLRLLDTWYADKNIRPKDPLPIPNTNTPPAPIARDIIKHASQGQAFDSLVTLIENYGGRDLLEGTVFAVATMVLTRAALLGVSIEGVANQLLPEAKQTAARDREDRRAAAMAPPGRKKKGRHVSGNPAHRKTTQIDRDTLIEFHKWLGDQPDTPADEAEVMETLMSAARTLRLNPQTPIGIEGLTDSLADIEDEDIILMSLVTLVDYTQFRLQRDPDDEWEPTADAVLHAFGMFQAKTVLEGAVDADADVDPEERRRSYAETRVVAKVRALLEWLGAGRKVTGSGNLRRADVAEAAAMLGVDAGAATLHPTQSPLGDEPSDKPKRGVPMRDIPVLASWWASLRVLEVTQITAGQAGRGPEADRWLAEPLPPLDLSERLIGVFVSAAIVVDSFQDGDDPAFDYAVRQLMHGVDPEKSPRPDPSTHLLVVAKSMQKLKQLELAGLVEFDQAGDVFVPPALRGVVAHAVILTLNAVAGLD